MQYYRVELDLPAVLGQNLKRQREKQGYTQEQFAERVGVDDRTLRRWESGGITRVDVIADVTAALGLSWWELFSDGEELPLLFYINLYDEAPPGGQNASCWRGFSYGILNTSERKVQKLRKPDRTCPGHFVKN